MNNKNHIRNRVREKRIFKGTILASLMLVICVFGYILSVSNAINEAASNSSGLSFSQIAPTDNNVTYQRLLFRTQAQKDLGVNGAGCQWPVSLESNADGSLMLYGTDVSGLYISTDHGANWELAVNGIQTAGVGMFAIDPNNNNHLVALGLGTGVGAFHVSYDKAQTWTKTFSMKTNGARYLWDGLEFDPTSFDSNENKTTDLYFSTPYDRDTYIRETPNTKPDSRAVLEANQVGLYKSTDGGQTFTLVKNDVTLADGIIKITDNGDVYLGNQYGLFKINKTDYSVTSYAEFENDPNTDYSKGVTGLDVVGNTIYVQTWEGIYTLENETITKITTTSYRDKWPQFLEVSKSNPNHMIYQVRSSITTSNSYYSTNVVVTKDGGQTWTDSQNNKKSLFNQGDWHGREKVFIIDPSDDDRVITFGSDDLLISTDGGLNFKQANGISNMGQGGRFNFNYYDPDLLLFSAQDYTGAVSDDGGDTFRQLQIPSSLIPGAGGKTLGNMYGGFAADRNTFFGFVGEHWKTGYLMYTHDGGQTWVNTGLLSEVIDAVYYSSLQSPTDPNVLFANEYYSKDKGYTWEKMTGCTSVFTFNYTGQKELYGADATGNIVRSYDNGDTWEKVSDVIWTDNNRYVADSQQVIDMGYDYVNNYVYLIEYYKLTNINNPSKTDNIEAVYKYDINTNTKTALTVPKDTNRGYKRLKTITVDPNSTSVVYIGGSGDYFMSSTALLRSVDGGENWSVLTTANDPNYEVKATNQGGYAVSNARVNPYDGRLWISEGGYGVQTINPPYDSSLLQHSKPATHTINFMYNGKKVNENTLNNNGILTYKYSQEGLAFKSWYKDEGLTQEVPVGSNIYESMTLYAKMESSIRVRFYDRNKFLWKIDLDKYDKGDANLIPTRAGYAFVGWYSDPELTTPADFTQITQDTNVYAGWYKVDSDIFDVNAQDMPTYIAYSNHKLGDNTTLVDNDAVVENRSIYTLVDHQFDYHK